MKILHLSFDIPDQYNPHKTVAVKNLIDSNVSNENFYISMNRSNNVFQVFEMNQSESSIELKFYGPPYGINLLNTLEKLYNNIKKEYYQISSFDIVHAHKLTYEGYMAYLIKKEYNIPYMVSLRFTDFKVLKIRKDYKKTFKKVLLESEKIFCIAPWMENELQITFGKGFYDIISDKIELLPNILNTENTLFENIHNNKYLTVFKISRKNLKRKNIFRTLDAIYKLNKGGYDIKLDIIGSGDGIPKLSKYIHRKGLSSTVNLIGNVPNDVMLETMKEYKAFILCSYPETFGLVYIEALLSGIPIINSKNAGIDGYFNDLNVSISTNYRDINAIANAIKDMEKNLAVYKNSVLKVQNSHYFELFSKDQVYKKYKNTLNSLKLDCEE
ncbi:glycosyltransferase [Turicibacter sp. H121]|uniref:glycosyltransferase n=1 Tax=Turicibacter sp. H121 TaxID=1712675 RepID=UPI0007631153|nr:glycosyltransferase [Turicibacter sp. H121]AMC08080.1 hypothetical protein AT726_03360 [Turicibacter sp. H121]MCU7199852.1 glycosyltransferase [Turicibacter sp. H121]